MGRGIGPSAFDFSLHFTLSLPGSQSNQRIATSRAYFEKVGISPTNQIASPIPIGISWNRQLPGPAISCTRLGPCRRAYGRFAFMTTSRFLDSRPTRDLHRLPKTRSAECFLCRNTLMGDDYPHVSGGLCFSWAQRVQSKAANVAVASGASRPAAFSGHFVGLGGPQYS